MSRSVFVPALAALALTGCAQILSGIIDGAANSAGNRIGQSIVSNNTPPPAEPAAETASAPPPRRSSGGMGAMYNPQFAYFYTQFLFTMAFGAGGYDMSTTPFKPGEFAAWSIENGTDKSGTIERAYLADDAKGQQWWRVKFVDPENNETTTLEGLFTKDLTRLVRLRGKFPNDKEGKEIPVDEGSYYMAPRRLSAESVQGATKGVEKVTVPAGSFDAKHVVFGGPEGTAEWWISDLVPGGLVKQLGHNGSDDDKRAMVLQKFGKDAKTELSSF